MLRECSAFELKARLALAAAPGLALGEGALASDIAAHLPDAVNRVRVEA